MEADSREMKSDHTQRKREGEVYEEERSDGEGRVSRRAKLDGEERVSRRAMRRKRKSPHEKH